MIKNNPNQYIGNRGSWEQLRVWDDEASAQNDGEER
jgi:hypothetical protein